jgi:hypothetical protein
VRRDRLADVQLKGRDGRACWRVTRHLTMIT